MVEVKGWHCGVSVLGAFRSRRGGLRRWSVFTAALRANFSPVSGAGPRRGRARLPRLFRFRERGAFACPVAVGEWVSRPCVTEALALCAGLRLSELLALRAGSLLGRPGERRVEVAGKGSWKGAAGFASIGGGIRLVGGLGSGCRAPGLAGTCRRSGFGRAGAPPRGSVFPDVGRGARWMDSGPIRRDVIPAGGRVFHDVGTPTPQTAHSTFIAGPAGDLGEQRRGPNHSCTRLPPGPRI